MLTKNQKNKIQELKGLLETFDGKDATTQGKIDQVIKDLGLDTDINLVFDAQKTTLAHYAAKEHYAVILDYLADHYKGSVNLEQQDNNGNTPAYYAAKENNHDTIRSLVNAGADFSDARIQKQLNKHGALDFLHECEDAKVIESLQENDCLNATIPDVTRFVGRLHNPNAVDRNGLNLAHRFAQYGNEEILNYLIEQGIDFMTPAKDGKNAFDRISDPDLRDKIKQAYQKKLSETNIDNITDWTKVNLAQVQHWVRTRVDLNAKPYAHAALKAGKNDIVEYMIQQGINLNKADADGKSLAQLAVEQGNREILMDLVEHSFEQNPVQWTDSGGNDILDSLKTRNQKLYEDVTNALNATESLFDFTRSPFPSKDWSTIEPDNIKELLDQGAKLNAREKDGKAPVSLAISNDNLEAFKFLADLGVKLDQPDNKGEVPAHHAVRAAIDGGTLNTEYIELLKEKNVNFNVQSNDANGKETPFHLAMQEACGASSPLSIEDQQNLAKALIDAGADWEITDKSGKKPLDYANDDVKEEIKAYIDLKKRETESEEIGAVESSPDEDENEAESSNSENSNGGSGNEAAKGKSGPGAAKRLADSLQGATDAFFKNVFEGRHNTAEEFAQDFLFNLLAFPLEATNILLTKTYSEDEKDKLDRLSKQLDQLIAQKNGVAPGDAAIDEKIPVSEKTKNLANLMFGLNKVDPGAIQALRNAIGENAPIELSSMTPEQRETRLAKINQALQADDKLAKRLQKALSTVIQAPDGKKAFESLFEGHTGPITKEQVAAIFGGGKPDHSPAPDRGSAPTDHSEPPVPEGATPKIQEAIMKSYQEIMDSTSLNKTEKKTKLEAFLIDLAEKHPEFKTLSAAVSLLNNHKTVLDGLKAGSGKGSVGTVTKKDDTILTNKGVANLKKGTKDTLKKLTDEEIKEAGKLALTLKKTLSKGSKDGALDPRARDYLEIMVYKQASRLDR